MSNKFVTIRINPSLFNIVVSVGYAFLLKKNDATDIKLQAQATQFLATTSNQPNFWRFSNKYSRRLSL